ncbi:MAG TPA: hypothetical protein PLL64_01260 [Rhodothermales bacterium]|nr:hypothetical protein [Rhodothermales bacterium]HRR09305.1 hypothetical protein [Rhodothermales bacterium]
MKNGFSCFVLLGSREDETLELLNNERYPAITATSLLDNQTERIVKYEDGTKSSSPSQFRYCQNGL